MAKDRQSKGENIRVKSHRNPNLLSHYHELSTRVFHNGERANEYLHNLFLKAAKNGEEERIRNFLARSSKNCNVNLNYKDKTTGNTAVVFAALKNHVNIVKMLLNYGADITLLNDNGQSIFDVAPNSIIPMLLASVERKGASNRHLLQAAWQGNLQMLRRLLNSSKAADLDVNCKNADGMTPLLLVTRDVNLFEKIEKTVAESGYSPLEVVKELLQHKADCSITTSDGKSPLHYIAHNKGAQAENMANMIIEDKNSQLDLPDKSNSLPIHLATRYDNRPVLLALINGGADVNARGQLGQTPLHVAATHGHERCSSDLLSSGADVTIVDDQGYSPVDVSKNRKVKMVLKEAWVEQTRECSSNKLKRTYSAPTEHMTEKEKKFNENVPESVSSPRVQKETSPRKISAGENIPCTLPDVSRSNESQVPHPPKTKSKNVKRSHSMTKTPGYMMPRPPRTSPCDSSNRTKYRTQIRQISSFSANAGMRSCRQELELPKLSITNIELQLSSCLRSDIPSQQSYCNRYSSIQRFRLLSNPSTLPLTPSTYLHESSSRMSDYSSSQGSGRVKLPKTLAPLSPTPSNDERKPSEDMRQGCSRNSLYSGHELVGDVLDLDNLESHSSCHPSLAKIVFRSDREIVQPPPSPCEEDGLDLDYPPSPLRDNELEYKMTNDKETASDNNDNTVRENRCHETVKDVKDKNLITASIEQSNENKKEELSLIENKAVSSCDNCLTNDYSDDVDDCYKTKTFCTADRSKFWIPCTQNGETSLGNTSNAMETSNNEINNPSKENKYKEQENTSAANKNDNEHVGTVILDERKEKMKNSVSFYVDFGDFKTHNSDNRTCKCGKIINNEKLNRCEKCTNRLPEKKTFWISLDGETSDGESEGVSGMKKVVERKGSSSEEGERFSRRAQSFPENKLLLKPKFTSKCIDLDAESQEQTFQENYLMVSSEDTFVIQPKGLEDSRNEVSEDVAKDDKEFQENSEMKFYSEDTFFIEKNVQKSGGESETIAQDTSERDQGLTGNEDDECIEGAGELHKDSKGDKGVVGGEHEVRSSIVLQSLSMDDDPQGHEQNDENGGTEITNPLCSEEKAKLQTEPKKNVETFKNDTTLFLKTAWSNDCPSVEQSPGVQICNAFPSPVPPVNLKPDVQPPIGNGLGKTKLRKTNSGKSKKKASAKESKKKDDKSSIGKEQAACFGKKGKKGKKGKGKKPKPMFKEISVNQSFGCMSYEGAASSVACEVKEGMLSPDLDKVPTLSIDSRGTTKLLRMKFSSLSPIPESPRSAVSVTPRGGEEGDSGDKDAVDNLEPQENSPRKVELVQQEERQSEMIGDDKVVNRDREDHVGDCCTVSNGGEGGQAETFDEGVDEVDGGMLSRFFNMCMPRLKMGSPESDSEALVNDDDDDVQDNDDDDDDDDDVKSCQDECPVDEADPEMEDLIQDILENHDHNEKDTYKIELTKHEDVLSEHNQSFSEQDNTGSSQENSIFSSDSTSSSNTCHPLGIKEKNEKKSLKENWTTNYVRQMTGFSPWEFDTTDDVFVQNENDDEVSVGTALNEEMMSDDSSYVSCESTSYAVSESSTTESNDSYFSSQESFHGMPSLSSHDNTTAGSVDINLHEQVHKPQTSATSSIGSSNDSRATLRPRSNSNSSETSVRSFFPSASKGFVRSQVSSVSGSLSSTTSCGEELQWQKGSILGKGGFGTVYLGLVNTGEMIAVKQVELSNKDESEAEKQYEKLQEEVSLLKSLHHQNIVRYIGTCLDDNSVVNIFMELVPGGSIAQALKRFGGAFVEPVFQRYTKQILSGVDYMHKKNVIHRDIKGGNIMLMPNGVIKLIDFGCAKRLCMSLSLSKSSIMHSMKGTPYWMAPEVIKETSGQGTKSDIWSIGCTVYEMATGNPPWSQMEPFAAMFAIGNGTTVPQLSNSFSQAARDFTAACMNRESSARPSASELLHHEFITQLL